MLKHCLLYQYFLFHFIFLSLSSSLPSMLYGWVKYEELSKNYGLNLREGDKSVGASKNQSFFSAAISHL